MAINKEDIKRFESQRLTDEGDGGGKATGNVVIDDWDTFSINMTTMENLIVNEVTEDGRRTCSDSTGWRLFIIHTAFWFTPSMNKYPVT